MTSTPPAQPQPAGAALEHENAVLREFVETSRDALWCIEFVEPVDLTAPEAEIIRQVFEHACVWRLCNPAMARLYQLPQGLDFNAQHVRFVFPRNTHNEAFIRTLIASNFHVDGVMSLDRDFDGRDIQMENDVRAHIESGRLHRMMGAVRNLTQRKAYEVALAEKVHTLTHVLGAMPQPVLVVDHNDVVQAVNPAFERVFGWRADDVLGRVSAAIVDFPAGPALSSRLPGPGEAGLDCEAAISHADGRSLAGRATLSAFTDTAGERTVVLVLQMTPILQAPGARRSWHAASESSNAPR